MDEDKKNQFLFNTVKNYDEDNSSINIKGEFIQSFVLQNKKEDLSVTSGPDLSRRNKS